MAQNSEEKDQQDLERILANDAKLLTETVLATAKETLEFVESELKRFRAKTECRTLMRYDQIEAALGK